MSTPHVEDIGTRVEYEFVASSTNLALDISSATVFSLSFEKPDGTVVVVDQATTPAAVAFVTDGTDGKIEYTVPDSTFWSIDGLWRLQGYVEVGAFKARGAVKVFTVERKVE